MLKPTSRQVTSSSRKDSASGLIPQKPSRLPPHPEPSREGFQASCRARARKISWVETWPKWIQGERPLEPSASGLLRSRYLGRRSPRKDDITARPATLPPRASGTGATPWSMGSARSSAGLAERRSRRRPRPAGGDLVGHLRPRRPVRIEGIGGGEGREALRDLGLEESAKGVRGRECGGCEPDREQAVPVHRLDPDRKTLRRRGQHAREEEEGCVVGHHHAGPGGHRGEEPPADPGRRLDVGVVADPGVGVGAGAVGHPLEDEGVEPVAGVRVGGADRLEDEDRAVELPRPLDGPVEGEVPRRPPEGSGPDEDVLPAGPHRGVIGRADPFGGDVTHGALPGNATPARDRARSATRRTRFPKMAAWMG